MMASCTSTARRLTSRSQKKRVPVYEPYVDKSVVFGIRPEDIADPNYAPPGIKPQMINAKVDVTELMGNEIFLYMNAGDHVFTARVDPRTNIKMGDDVQVAFNMANMHVFDRDTEQAIR